MSKLKKEQVKRENDKKKHESRVAELEKEIWYHKTQMHSHIKSLSVEVEKKIKKY